MGSNDNNLVQVGQTFLGKIKKLLYVDDRKNLPAHIGKPQDKCRCARQRRELAERMDFADIRQFDAIVLRRQEELHNL